MATLKLDPHALGSRDITQLLAVADCGSIRRAAEALGMTQPGLSKNIRQIEARLGFTVFQRSTAGATPTEIGVQLLQRGRQVLLDLAAIERDLRQDVHTQAHSVRIGCGVVAAPIVARRALPKVLADMPELAIDMQVASPLELVERLLTGDFDFVIASTDGMVLPPVLVSSLLQTTAPMFFVRDGHPLAARRGVRLPELANWRLACAHNSPPIEAWLRAEIGVVTTDTALKCDDFELLGEAVAASEMIGLTSPAILETLQRRLEVVTLDVPGITIEHNIHCIRPAKRPLSRPAKLVLAQIEAVLAQPPVALQPQLITLKRDAGYERIGRSR